MKTSTKKNFVKFLIPFLTLSLSFVSCSQDELLEESKVTTRSSSSEEPLGKKVGDLIIDKSTVLLDPLSLIDAKVISEELLVFKPAEDQVDEIVLGAILVGVRYNGELAENVMGRVKNITVSGADWYVDLTPVNLEEFILDGTISGRVELKDVTEKSGFKSKKNVVVFQDIPGFPSYNLNNDAKTKAVVNFPRLEFDRTFVFPAIPENTIGDVGGSFSLKAGFTPVIDYTIKFELFKGITDFKIVLYAKNIILDSHLKAYGSIKYYGSVADSFPIPIAPIVLGPTGLVISPTLAMGPFLGLELSTALDAKLFHVEGDISYQLSDPTKKPVFNLVSDPYSWNENLDWTIKFNAETGLECRAGISLLFINLNIASVGASAKLALGMDAVIRPTNSASISIYGLGEASANIKIGVPPLQFVKSYEIATWKPIIFAQEYNW